MFVTKKQLDDAKKDLMGSVVPLLEQINRRLRDIDDSVGLSDSRLYGILEILSNLENNRSNTSAKTKEGVRVSLDSVLDIIKKNAGKNGITSNQVVEILQDRGMTESFEILQSRVCSTIWVLRSRGLVVQVNDSNIRKLYKAT